MVWFKPTVVFLSPCSPRSPCSSRSQNAQECKQIRTASALKSLQLQLTAPQKPGAMPRSLDIALRLKLILRCGARAPNAGREGRRLYDPCRFDMSACLPIFDSMFNFQNFRFRLLPSASEMQSMNTFCTFVTSSKIVSLKPRTCIGRVRELFLMCPLLNLQASGPGPLRRLRSSRASSASSAAGRMPKVSAPPTTWHRGFWLLARSTKLPASPVSLSILP